MRFVLAWVSVGASALALNGCFQVGDDDASGDGGESGDGGTKSSGGSAGSGTLGGSAGSAKGGKAGSAGRADRGGTSSFLGRAGREGSAGSVGEAGSGGDSGETGSGGTGGSVAKGGSSGKGGSGGSSGKGGGSGKGGSAGGPPGVQGTCEDYDDKFETCDIPLDGSACLPSLEDQSCLFGCYKAATCDEITERQCALDPSNELVDCLASCTFDCGGGDLIPVSWQCDKEADCTDGSDEAACPTAVCPVPTPGAACTAASANFSSCGLLPEGTFTGCQDRTEGSACLYACTAAAGCSELEAYFCGTLNSGTLASCLAGCSTKRSDFYCQADDSWKPASYICDTENDCSDGADEVDCTFTCHDGGTLPMLYTCDGSFDGSTDCADGSDEAGCGFTCPSGG